MAIKVKNDERYDINFRKFFYKVPNKINKQKRVSVHILFSQYSFKSIYFCAFDLNAYEEERLNSLGKNVLPYVI